MSQPERPIGRGRARLITAATSLSTSVRPGPSSNASSTETLEFPKSAMGLLIGKGGAKVKEIREESGANVDISADDAQNKCIVKISGLKLQTDKAKKIVEDLNNNVGGNNSFSVPSWGSSQFGAPVVDDAGHQTQESSGKTNLSDIPIIWNS